jgi:hypothetical protein
VNDDDLRLLVFVERTHQLLPPPGHFGLERSVVRGNGVAQGNDVARVGILSLAGKHGSIPLKIKQTYRHQMEMTW